MSESLEAEITTAPTGDAAESRDESEVKEKPRLADLSLTSSSSVMAAAANGEQCQRQDSLQGNGGIMDIMTPTDEEAGLLEYSIGNAMNMSEELHLIHKPSEPRRPLDDRPLPKRSKVRTTDPRDTLEILVESEGLAADEPTTVGKVFKSTVSRIPDHTALRYKEDGVWNDITYKEYYDLVIKAAKGFLKLGLEEYHAVSIIGFNSPEWLISSLGAMFAGGLSAGIYTTNGPEACHFVANDCQANVIVVENQKQLDKILAIRDRLPHLKAIVQYKGELSQAYDNVYDWKQFLALGEDMEDGAVEEMIAAQRPEQCAVLIYTSGTTGNPKGVMLSHDNITWTMKCFGESYGGLKFGGEHCISYLPLSHMAAQTTDMYMPITYGATVHFAQPDALKGSLKETILEVQPTIFFGVPRIYEKMKEAIEARSEQIRGLKKRLSNWARKKGLKGNLKRQNSSTNNGKPSLPRGWTIAEKLVFKKVRVLLGFQRTHIFVIGSAPVSKEVHDFFMSLNMPLMELYGMSESSGPETLNFISKHRWRTGSCGPVLDGLRLKIFNPDKNEEGEICYYGRHVFMGYLNNEEKTREAIDDEGWLHSGDIGRIDEDGFLWLTGRKKELIITSGGENIPPAHIESLIKAELPYLSNVFVIGDHRKYLTCLVTLLSEVDLDSGEPSDQLAEHALHVLRDIGSKCTTVSQVLETRDETIYADIQAGLDRANKKAISNAQKVQKFTVLSKDFSIPGGELGPTLKLRRSAVTKKYADIIEAMYAETTPKK